jgi:hypothetical protein
MNLCHLPGLDGSFEDRRRPDLPQAADPGSLAHLVTHTHLRTRHPLRGGGGGIRELAAAICTQNLEAAQLPSHHALCNACPPGGHTPREE